MTKIHYSNIKQFSELLIIKRIFQQFLFSAADGIIDNKLKKSCFSGSADNNNIIMWELTAL